jgi:hypothetical protein
MLAQIDCTEALGELLEQDQGMQERVHALIGKAQARGRWRPTATGRLMTDTPDTIFDHDFGNLICSGYR